MFSWYIRGEYMTAFPNSDGDKPVKIIDTAKTFKDVIELVTWTISIGIAVLSFLRTPGSLTQFLIQVGTYGFACYIAIWMILFPVLYLINYLDKTFHRETTDTAAAIVVGISVLGGGVLILSGFAPDAYKDLDTLGTAFMVLLGIVTLAIPFLLLWYYRGSTPRSK